MPVLTPLETFIATIPAILGIVGDIFTFVVTTTPLNIFVALGLIGTVIAMVMRALAKGKARARA